MSIQFPHSLTAAIRLHMEDEIVKHEAAIANAKEIIARPESCDSIDATPDDVWWPAAVRVANVRGFPIGTHIIIEFPGEKLGKPGTWRISSGNWEGYIDEEVAVKAWNNQSMNETT